MSNRILLPVLLLLGCVTNEPDYRLNHLCPSYQAFRDLQKASHAMENSTCERLQGDYKVVAPEPDVLFQGGISKVTILFPDGTTAVGWMAFPRVIID